MTTAKTAPVKTSDTLWFLGKPDVFAGTVQSVYEDFCVVRMATSQFTRVYYTDFGRNVFLTRAEALYKSCFIS